MFVFLIHYSGGDSHAAEQTGRGTWVCFELLVQELNVLEVSERPENMKVELQMFQGLKGSELCT
jgi:hypothetical protein